MSPLGRVVRGAVSAASAVMFPLGRWWRPGLQDLCDPSRLEHGSVIILPGIEGRSLFNVDIALGLADGGVRSHIEVIDWTTGVLPLAFYHLRSTRLHDAGADQVAARIVDYQTRYPGRPVQLIGYSGGGGVALYALQRLPAGHRVTSVILLGSAVSPRFDAQALLRRTERGIWNYYSPLDMLFLGALTSLCGTFDGRHCISAGAVGFDDANHGAGRVAHAHGEPRLHEICYDPAMVRQFHLGGHFGWTNRVFVAEEIARLIRSAELEFAG
jgi:pimeloyl-ACP methyl ester carboxylesterase